MMLVKFFTSIYCNNTTKTKEGAKNLSARGKLVCMCCVNITQLPTFLSISTENHFISARRGDNDQCASNFVPFHWKWKCAWVNSGRIMIMKHHSTSLHSAGIGTSNRYPRLEAITNNSWLSPSLFSNDLQLLSPSWCSIRCACCFMLLEFVSVSWDWLMQQTCNKLYWSCTSATGVTEWLKG